MQLVSSWINLEFIHFQNLQTSSFLWNIIRFQRYQMSFYLFSMSGQLPVPESTAFHFSSISFVCHLSTRMRARYPSRIRFTFEMSHRYQPSSLPLNSRTMTTPLTLVIRLRLRRRGCRFATSASLPRTIFRALDFDRATTPFRARRDWAVNPLPSLSRDNPLITLTAQTAGENRTTLHSAIFHSSVTTRETIAGLPEAGDDEAEPPNDTARWINRQPYAGGR